MKQRPSRPDRRVPAPVAFEALEGRALLAAVAYDLGKTAQTIESIGGNYAKAPFHDTANDAIGQYTLDHLKPGVVRVPILLPQWEPVNDNADPDAADAAAFAANDTGEVRDVFLMMQEYERRGLTIVASAFNAPDWMVSNPDNKNQRVIDAAQWPELVESMRTFLEHAKTAYGVTVDYVSFNEANGGYSLLFTAQQLADFIELAGPELSTSALGSPKFLVGDTFQVTGTAAYARTILSDAGAKPYLGPIAFHTWWSEKTGSTAWKEIAALGKEFGKPVWATEIGYDATAWTTTPWIFSTWQNASRLAQIYHKSLTWGGANVALYWQYQDDFPLMSANTSTKYYAYHVIKQLVDNLPKGSQVVSAASDTSSVMALGAKHAGNGTFFTQLINTSTSGQSVTLTGLPNEPLTLVRTSNAGEKSKTVGTYTPVNGRLTLTLPGSSVSGLTGKLPATTPPPPSGGAVTVGTGTSAYVRNGSYAGTNFGSDATLVVKKNATTGNSRESYLKFDLNGVAPITSAKLRLYGRLAGTENPSVAVNVYGASNTSWSEGALTWNSKPAAGTTVRGTFSVVGTVARWYEVDLTSFLKAEQAAGRKVVTLVLKAPTNHNALVWFNSDDAASNKPELALQTGQAQPPPPPTSGESVTVGTNTAAYVRNGTYGNTNYGTASELIVKKSGTTGNTRHAYLKFDLSGVASIGTATLRLFGRMADSQNASAAVSVFNASNTSWSEAGLTWNNRPASGTTARGSFTVTGTTGRWYDVDLTNFLKAEKAAGRDVVTLVLQATTTTDSLIVFGSDEGAAANVPQLRVTT